MSNNAQSLFNTGSVNPNSLGEKGFGPPQNSNESSLNTTVNAINQSSRDIIHPDRLKFGFARDSKIWSFVNKFIYTFILLGASVTVQFDFFGFAYFSLFLIHSFAYYALRISDQPIDILKNLRKNKRNIRGLFSYIFILVTFLIFISIITGKIINSIYEIQGSQTENEVQTNAHAFYNLRRCIDLKFAISSVILTILITLCPNYNSTLSLIQSFGMLLSAILFFKILKKEEQEAQGQNLESLRVVDHITKVELLKNYQIQKAVQLIKDYKFKNQVFIHLEILLLTLISSASCTILILPYMLVFMIQNIILAFAKSEGMLNRASKRLNLILISLLMSDLLAEYFFKASTLNITSASDGFYAQVVGLLSTLPSYFEFYSKILLLAVECQRIQYSYDYKQLNREIKKTFQEKNELQKLFRKRQSFTYKIIKPVSIFMFCSTAILFNLLHPQIVFLILTPLCVYGFFMKEDNFKKVSRLMVVTYCLYLVTKYSFYIAFLLLPDNQQKEDYFVYLERIIGVQRDLTIQQKLFPVNFDFAMCLILSYLSHCIQIEDNYSADSQDMDGSRLSSLLKNGYEDDMLTIPDDVSEVRSMISYKTGPRFAQGPLSERSIQFTSRFRAGQQVPETIIEDKKEEDEAEDGRQPSVLDTSRTQSIAPTVKSFKKQIKSSKTSMNMQKDETFRGSIRRVLFRIYIKLRIYFDNLLDLLIIHSAKFALCGIFIVSVTHANLFNAGLFIIFLFLSISNYREVQKYWKIPIVFDSFILISLYGIDVFKPSEIFDMDETTLKLIGISEFEKDDIRLLRYTPYLVLLSVLVITYYILNSQRYEEFLTFYNQIEMRDRLDHAEEEESPFLNQRLRGSQIGLSDKLTKFIIKYSLYLMLIALFVECSLLPVSVLNFILLALMCIITIKYLQSSNSIELYKSINGNLMALKWISLVFIFLKYMFQFEDFAYTITFKQANENKSYYEHLPLIEKLLGIENSLVPIKLFSLALVMSISNLQLKFVSFKYLSNILKEQDQEWERTQIFTSRFKVFIHHAKMYLLFGLYHFLLPLPILLTIYYSLQYVSAIGALLFISSVLIIFKQKEDFWLYQHVKISQITSLALLITYGFQFIFLNININEQFVRWLGVVKQDEQVNLIYAQLIPLFLILAVCALQKESTKLVDLFKVTIQQGDIIMPEQTDDEDQNKLNQSNYESQQAKFIFEKPIRNCLIFRDNVMKRFFYSSSNLISIFVLLCIILHKLNIIAIIQVLILISIFKQNYYPNRYHASINHIEARNRMSRILKISIITMAVILVFEYTMMMGPAYLFDFTSWKVKVSSLFCLSQNDECYQEWQEWLSISNIPAHYIVIDLLGLICLTFSYFFISDVIQIDNLVEQEQVKCGDQHDFLSNKNKDKCRYLLLNIIFQGFPYILIGYMMIFAASFHGSGTSDLLSAGYLLSAMYYIINFRRLFTKNQKMIDWIKTYNLIVLMLFILFQIPLFICPSINTSWSFQNYITREQCSLEMKKFSVDELQKVNPLLAFYMVFTQSIGLVKVDNIQFDFIIMIILVELQNQIFSHPYFQVYVLEHMKLEKETDGKLRAFIFVEKTHLHKLWSYKAIKQEIKILHSRLLKINNTISNQEFSRYLLFESQDQESFENQNLLQNDDKSNDSDSIFNQTQNLKDLSEAQQLVHLAINKLIDEYQDEIENISLQLLQQPDVPVVPINYFSESFKQYLKSREDLHPKILAGDIDQSLREELLGYCIMSQSISISYFVILLNFILTPSLISLIPALSILIYALTDFPVPNVRYFKYLMIYMLSVVAVKFTYQLPIFCGSIPFTLFTSEGCPAIPVVPETILKRFDFVIGISKFSGPYSYPKDQGILRGLIGDLIVLLSLLVLKNYLIKIGIWHFVKTRSNIYQSPSFKCSYDELTEKERLNLISKENYVIYEYEQARFFEKIGIIIKKQAQLVWRYILKLMPTYMNPQQRNLDLRSQEQIPQITHSVKQVKPGKDFFTINFFSLLLILIYNLFWYRSVIGEQQSGAALSTANLQRFSTPQVGLIFLLLILMMGERMLFRVRYFDHSQFTNADSGLLGKHQLTIKFILHLILVISIHLYLGFFIPRHAMNSSYKLFPLIVSYFLWILYFVGSALQIKHGYPQAPFKAPFTRDTSFFKVLAFRVYKAIPFLWEMKVIIDWTVTATCLDLFQWFKLDDAYNYLYWNKYQIDERRKRSEYAQRTWDEKFFQGFCFAFGLIIVILAPILLFSGINPIMVKNPIQQGQLSISFELNRNGNTYSILQSQAFNIAQLTSNEVENLQNYFNPINVQFSASDMQKMRFSPYSESEWSISPPSLEKFIDDFNYLKEDKEAFVEIKSNWVFKRNNPVGNEATSAQYTSKMNIQKLQPIIDMLEQDLQTDQQQQGQNSTNTTFTPISKSTINIDNLLPKVFKLGSSQQSTPLELQPMTSMSALSACELSLNRLSSSQSSLGLGAGGEGGFYWTYTIPSSDQQGLFGEIANNITRKSSNNTQVKTSQPQNLVVISYNEEVIGSLFGSAFQLSVVGLYATIVVAIGRFLRLIFDRISQRVIYEEMNDIETLFEICEGIFIAQLEGDLVREKKLYELLIRIYRSPETLMKITEHQHHHLKGRFVKNSKSPNGNQPNFLTLPNRGDEQSQQFGRLSPRDQLAANFNRQERQNNQAREETIFGLKED